MGSVESIDLSDENLAEVHVEVEQELHEGTTATIRATSLSGVANHYVSISPGPNSNPALDEGAELGLASTTTPVDIDQFFNTFPPSGPQGARQLHQGQRGDLRRPGPRRQQRLQVLRHRAQPDQRLRPRTERRPAPASNTSSSARASCDHRRRSRRTALQRDRQRQHRVQRDRQPERRLRPEPAPAAAGHAAGEHDLRQPPRRARRPRSAGRTRRSRRPRNLAPFLAELRPGRPESSPSPATCASTVNRPGKANDLGRPADDAAHRPERPRRPSRTPKRRSPPSSPTSTSPAPTRPTSSTVSARFLPRPLKRSGV